MEDTIEIARETPLGADLAELHARHTAAMHEDTPPESIHMLPPDALAAPGISFFVMRQAGRPVGMGALKRIAPDEGEIKSMHILSEMRGQGLARRMLEQLIAAARDEGMARLYLETGSQDSFAPARQLYLRAGFAECGPYVGYQPDPNSVFLMRAI
ncbi:GNAT family N-acetyltransferase [Thioclava sp. DLFJ4-1]|uniref:GNAT family N-acetyltransferase n=1 Tax=Thioclava sp. DLFJ4-1 TaxID=1915313 RepID=UPI000997DBF7|nr:GNAT family N-acetyltransferase [Thioclava sp. DLFJ4-1]OOY16498.1 GNAT family N-acetyltransferase [Thioclava sp. DLFJ4-1]